ncbi:MAG: Asp-tRNA(Asn)/Glu-tRNA(Gln) amidotransferase subunit GatA [Spirochaetales bacterium]|uniref:Glutamyl-tRNA(Gln) amidotransferase subunit A n=1 Tax=Candidatus Thalassospirochaeta sargassi TaxID=3119039 RepID=A0AAJ1MJ06_9SPIO|nr:Asp-tRNA(Asn)/Glu-tRNA(Gln) amidotransferase subunit GatA [Spirochaetales bacterium]
MTELKEHDKDINSFLEFASEDAAASVAASANQDGPLAGLTFGVKDNIAVEGMHLTCGSKMLKDFVSPYDATAVRKLKEAGAVCVGKTNLDEFGMGSSTDNSALAVTNNPWDLECVCGGSSGGSAAAVAAGLVPFALGTDTGGSVRQPASFCGVYGLKPTYGVVSRFGLVAYASSLEVCGILADSVDTTRKVFEVIKGKDGSDQTSIDHIPASADAETVAVLAGDLGLKPEVETAYKKAVDGLKSSGMKIIEVELPMLDYGIAAYYTIAMAEASANLARYNGVRYGHRSAEAGSFEDLMRMSRDEGFGDEVKLRILLGTYVLRSGFQDQYYTRAQKIRTAVRNEFDGVFTKADMIMLPAFPTAAFKHGDQSLDQFQQKLADKFTVAANLSGMPAMSVPVSVENGLPVGMQLMAPVFAEERIFKVAEKLAEVLPPAACPLSMAGQRTTEAK